jgi:hypothetical protein
MNDTERDHLWRRLAESERARCRWRWLALAGTPLLAGLLAMMAAFGTSSYLMLRDAIRREQEARDAVNVDVSLNALATAVIVELNSETEEQAKMLHELARSLLRGRHAGWDGNGVVVGATAGGAPRTARLQSPAGHADHGAGAAAGFSTDTPAALRWLTTRGTRRTAS